MADMFPRELLPDEVKSNGERKTFDALRDGVGDPWQAYHSVSWVARDQASGAIDGEIDFVGCHPEQGVVCLEVKGGTVESRSGSWYAVRAGEHLPAAVTPCRRAGLAGRRLDLPGRGDAHPAGAEVAAGQVPCAAAGRERARRRGRLPLRPGRRPG